MQLGGYIFEALHTIIHKSRTCRQRTENLEAKASNSSVLVADGRLPVPLKGLSSVAPARAGSILDPKPPV